MLTPGLDKLASLFNNIARGLNHLPAVWQSNLLHLHGWGRFLACTRACSFRLLFFLDRGLIYLDLLTDFAFCSIVIETLEHLLKLSLIY